MATIADLLNQLEFRAHTLIRTPEDTVRSHLAGWMPLARTTQQAVALLPLGGRGEIVKAGVRNVLQPLARGPRQPLDGDQPAPQLVDLSQIMGGISDTLADNLRTGGRAEHAGTEALKLEASLLSAVHVAARWSRSTMDDQKLPTTRSSVMAFLNDLAVITEPYALIPPGRRASTLEELALRAPNTPGIEGAAVAWAHLASETLTERYRISSWAMQAIAGDLALLSHTARSAVLAAAGSRELLPPSASLLSDSLDVSTRAWRTAATWPPYLRLGGRNVELREASRDLREAIATGASATLGSWRRVLGVAMPVALGHAAVMRSLVRKHELWIHSSAVDPVDGYARGWGREPRWSQQGQLLLAAALVGSRALDDAVSLLSNCPQRDTSSSPHRWGPVHDVPDMTRQDREPRAPVESPTASPRL
jgi:hypothetical protein